jgi:AcrR family transcriptional regulator
VRDIAEEANISLEEFYDHFDEKSDVLIAYGRRIDRAVLAAFAELDYESKARDRLFDILMERFDLANRDRDAVLSILHSFKLDPKQALISCPSLSQSMTRMLEAAGLDTAGFRGAARVAGLTGLFMCVLRVWMKDESEDMSETMAALDKGLSRMESAANSLGL